MAAGAGGVSSGSPRLWLRPLSPRPRPPPTPSPLSAALQGGQLSPIDLIVEERFHRAAPGGMGGTKAAGNYSPVGAGGGVAGRGRIGVPGGGGLGGAAHWRSFARRAGSAMAPTAPVYTTALQVHAQLAHALPALLARAAFGAPPPPHHHHRTCTRTCTHTHAHQGTSHRPVTGQICPLLAADRTSRAPCSGKAGTEKKWKAVCPVAGNPDQPRPDQLCPPGPRPRRNSRSRPQRSTLQSVVVAGRAPKSSQAARQNRRRPRAKRDAPRQVGAARGR